MTTPNNQSHYINNQEFHKALTEYCEVRNAALAAGKESPQVSNYIGECFLKIARGLGQKHNFRHYSYLNDMISNAVITCLKNMNSFDVSRGTSAFSYFTQTIFFSFLGTIKMEKQEESKRRHLFMQGNIDTFSSGEDEDFVIAYN